MTIITAIKGPGLSPFVVEIRRRSSLWAAAIFLVAMRPAEQVVVAATRSGFDVGTGCHG
ncbi:MAG: hypothetical protein RLN69_14480 [Woeseiaceae bacterium]